VSSKPLGAGNSSTKAVHDGLPNSAPSAVGGARDRIS